MNIQSTIHTVGRDVRFTAALVVVYFLFWPAGNPSNGYGVSIDFHEVIKFNGFFINAIWFVHNIFHFLTVMRPLLHVVTTPDPLEMF